MYELRSDYEQLFNLSFDQVVHPPSTDLDLTIVRSREYADVYAGGPSPDTYPIIASEGRGPRAAATLGAAALPEAIDPDLLELELEVELAVTYPEEPESEPPDDDGEPAGEETPEDPPTAGEGAGPPVDPPDLPPNGGETDGEGEWNEDDRIMAIFDSGLPRVDRETVRAMRASLRDDPHLIDRMVEFMTTEQPRLMQFVDGVIANHTDDLKEGVALMREIAVLYCLLAAQNVADRMDEVYGFGVKDIE